MVLKEIRRSIALLDRDQLIDAVEEALQPELTFGSALLVDFARQTGEGYGGFCEPSDHPEFAEYLKNFVRIRAQELVDDEVETLADEFELLDDKIVAWRSITASPSWVHLAMHGRHLGVCWAFDPDRAVAHEGSLKHDDWVELRLEALIDPVMVDWFETIVLNAVDYYTVGEECEIRLTDDAVVDLLRVENLETDRIIADHSDAPITLPAGELATRVFSVNP